MKKQPPSIFNDVIGPVMRGPSSSHTAASVRIGKIIRQFMKGGTHSVTFEFEPQGSLATTFKSQGSDIGLAGGLLGMETADPLLVNSLEIAKEQNIDIIFKITAYNAPHPNTYRVSARGSGNGEEKSYRFTFISTGGGMFELTDVNDIAVKVNGDYFETLVFINTDSGFDQSGFNDELSILFPEIDYYSYKEADSHGILTIKTGRPASAGLIEHLNKLPTLDDLVSLSPVLPIASGKYRTVPFSTAAELLGFARANPEQQLWELAAAYESARGDIAADHVLKMGREIIVVMKEAVRIGLAGTSYSDRILGPQAYKILQNKGKLFGGEPVKNLVAYITAIMETKSSMGVIVAAPTAGSCAGLPGTLIAAAQELNCDDEALLHGLLAASIIGVIIAGQSTFAAEESGCQAECGSGSAMAAAGLVQLAGGSVEQALAAASMAMQNIIGMVCDPVANRVEVPCLGKNVLAGMNAVAAANMALSGFDQVIPLDETIAAFDQAGRMLPAELRCTGKAGLSVVASSIALSDKLCRIVKQVN
jgi:L-serine dehydratase